MIIDNKVVALLLSCAICVGTTSSASAVDIEKKVNSGVSFSERASKYWNSFKKDVALGSFSIASFLGFIYQTVSKNKVAKEIEEANRQRDEANRQRNEANQRAERAEAAQKACSDRLRYLEQQNGELTVENDRYRARFVTIVTPGGVFSGATSRDVYFHDQQERFLNALEYAKGRRNNWSIWNEDCKKNQKNDIVKAKEIYLERFNSTPEEQRYGVGLELASAYFDKFIAPHSTQK